MTQRYYSPSYSPAAALAGAGFYVLVFVGAWLLMFGQRFDNYFHGRVVQGEVTDISSSYSRGRIWHKYQISYDGHEKWTYYFWYASVGDKAYINYLPEKPQQAYPQWGADNGLLNLLFSGGACIWSVLALLSFGSFASEIPHAWGYYRYQRDWHSANARVRRCVPFLLFTALFCFMLLWASNRLDMLDLYLNGRIENATVKFKDKRNSGDSEFAYTIVSGKNSFYISSAAAYKPGTKLHVYYNPDRPDTAVIRDEPYSIPFLLAGNYGWAMCAVMLFLGWAAWRSLPARLKK